MDPTVFLGMIVGVGLLLNAIGIDIGIKLFLHPSSLMIVLGGTLGATLVHFPISQLMKLGGRLMVIFSLERRSYKRDIDLVTEIGDKLKKEGRLSLSKELLKIKDHFLRNALQLLIDRISVEELGGILRENIEYMCKRHDQGIRFFEQMAKYAPGFGLIGTLIGLIVMLAQLDDPSKLGPSMSVALVTTFYGVLLANLVFLPLAGRLRISSDEEILQKEMLLQGVLSLANEESSYLIREKMSMLLPEKERIKLKKDVKKT
jgi:chemotaxis protein MotA